MGFGVVGSLGHLPFICSHDFVLTPNKLSRDHAARWAKHEIIGKKPVLEYIGPDLSTASLTICFDMSLGAPPAILLLRLKKMLENKKYKTLIIGGEYLGKWVMKSVSEDRKFHNGLGVCIKAEATIELEEWAG